MKSNYSLLTSTYNHYMVDLQMLPWQMKRMREVA